MARAQSYTTARRRQRSAGKRRPSPPSPDRRRSGAPPGHSEKLTRPSPASRQSTRPGHNPPCDHPAVEAAILAMAQVMKSLTFKLIGGVWKIDPRVSPFILQLAKPREGSQDAGQEDSRCQPSLGLLPPAFVLRLCRPLCDQCGNIARL